MDGFVDTSVFEEKSHAYFFFTHLFLNDLCETWHKKSRWFYKQQQKKNEQKFIKLCTFSSLDLDSVFFFSIRYFNPDNSEFWKQATNTAPKTPFKLPTIRIGSQKSSDFHWSKYCSYKSVSFWWCYCLSKIYLKKRIQDNCLHRHIYGVRNL